MTERSPGEVDASLRADHFARRGGDYAAFLLPHLRPGMEVLDGGCGPGSISLALARAVTPGRLVGVDLDEAQLARAAGAAVEQGVANAEFRRGDLLRLPFPDASFDAAYTSRVLEYLPDPVAALREVRRVLRPGGVAGVVSPDNGGMVVWPPDSRLEQFRALHEEQRRAAGVDNFVGRRLRAALLEAGFARAEASASMETYGTPEQTRYYGDALARLFIEGGWRERYLELGLADAATVAALADAWREWGARPDAFHATPRCEALGWVD